VIPSPVAWWSTIVARLWAVSGLLEEAAFELDAEVGVGAVAVEGGAVDVRLGGEGFDVAAAAGRDLAAQ
jgi:hypothetical protein